MPPQRNDIRNDNGTTPCPVCARPFTPIRRQQYCTPACRQSAWRTRRLDNTPPPTIVLAPRTPRRQTTVYQCPECDTRHLGRQWCDDCNRPCVRVDYGGLCPNCDEPVAMSDLIDRHPTPPTSR